MKDRTHCRVCGQLLKPKRMGVELSPLKARIFDLINLGGADGVTSTSLIEMCGIGGAPERRLRTLNVHVNQINARLAPTGWSIVGRDWRKFMIKEKKKGLATRVKT